MAIAVNRHTRPLEDWRDQPDPLTEEDIETLKFRLALEGIECHYPVHTGLIRIRHPHLGETNFHAWDTLLAHCNEGWSKTYWGPVNQGLASVN